MQRTRSHYGQAARNIVAFPSRSKDNVRFASYQILLSLLFLKSRFPVACLVHFTAYFVWSTYFTMWFMFLRTTFNHAAIAVAIYVGLHATVKTLATVVVIFISFSYNLFLSWEIPNYTLDNEIELFFCAYQIRSSIVRRHSTDIAA